jgi:tRNA pseudouridine38-40 synthase
MRFALGVEYDGSDFSGWETQRDRRSVQATLESALTSVADEPVKTVCAGRTDAGVHGLGQVVHFDCDAPRELQAWTLGVNTRLPDDVSVIWARRVPASFHARYAALRRHYRYVIFNRRARPAILRRRVAWVHGLLDAEPMQAAAEHLIGEHDFSSFRAAGCQSRSAVRTVFAIRVERHGELVTVDVSANAFLQHMVRNIAGVLLEVGKGRREPHWARRVLEARDRSVGGVTASPHGLYLARVDYPPELELPAVSPEVPLW